MRKFSCQLLGTIATSNLYRSSNDKAFRGSRAYFEHGVGLNRFSAVNLDNELSNPSRFHKSEFKKTAEEHLKTMIDSEVKTLEKAAESGLEKLLANVIVILGICLSTGLAPWTTVRSQESVATQIGSYAIILSVGTGVTSIIASLNSLSTAVDSATALRRFQNYIFSIDNQLYGKTVVGRYARFGFPFTLDPNIPDMITLSDLFSSTTSKRRWILWLVWGPAMGLIPQTRDGSIINWLWKPLLGLYRWAVSCVLPKSRRKSGQRLAGDDAEEMLLLLHRDSVIEENARLSVASNLRIQHDSLDGRHNSAVRTVGPDAPTAVSSAPTTRTDPLTVASRAPAADLIARERASIELVDLPPQWV